MLNIKINKDFAKDHSNYIIPFLRKRITKLVRTNRLKKKGEYYSLSDTEKSQLANLLNNDILKQIVQVEPQNINTLINNYSDYNTGDLQKFIYNIFVTHGYENIKKYEFVKQIGLNTCPYCNRNYIYTITNKNFKPEIDHFYPKDKYPILAVSYFNLIPSCSSCNGFGGKENKDPSNYYLKNPYEIKDEDFKFEAHIKKSNILNPITNIDDSSVKITFKDKISGHLEVFNLDELYMAHRDIVIELYIKNKIEYSSGYFEHLKKLDLFKFSDDEIERLIICNYTNKEDLHKRPLVKMMRDISKQFKNKK